MNKSFVVAALILFRSFISFSQNFQEKIIQQVNDWQIPKIIDIDNDGLDDLVSVSIDGTIVWWKKDTTSNYTKIVLSETHKILWSFDVADMDGDNDLDILIGTLGSIEIYYNDGNQNFSPFYIDANNWNTNVLAGDFDSDGLVDFISSSNASNGRLKFWKNYGDPNLAINGFLYSTIATVPIENGEIQVNDIDNDGDLDLIVSPSTIGQGNTIVIFLNDGQANFTEYDLNYTQHTKQIQVIDYDNDGDKDFVAINRTDDIVLFSNDGDMNFTDSFIFHQDDIGAMRVFDYDNDGDLDIAIAYTPITSYGNNPNENSNLVRIIINNGDGTFSSSVIDYIDNVNRFKVFDYNSDGITDLLAVSETFDDPVIYQNTGSGFNKIVLDDSFVYPTSFYAADIDNDGFVDVVSTSKNELELVLWHNTGNMDFNKRVIDSFVPYINYAYIDDINEDGYKDILVSYHNTDMYNPMGKILLYINDGNLNFTKTVLFDEIMRDRAFSKDVDNDGDKDIIYSIFANNGVIRYKRNDGNGNYQTVVVGQIHYGYCLDCFDVNNDGYNDFVTDKNFYFQNDGTSQNFVEISLPAAGVFFDIDNDGDLDLISSYYDYNNYINIFSWFENDGSGNYTEHIIDNTSTTNSDDLIVVQDFDGDGDIDFVSCPRNSYNSRKLSLWTNDGNYNFTRTVVHDDYWTVHKLLSADFDRDGDIDILSSNTIFPFTIWENRSDVPVIDTPPVPDNPHLPILTDQCEISAPAPPTATDNEDGQITGTTNTSFPITTQGTHTILWTFTDSGGNSVIQPQTAIINDTIIPNIPTLTINNVTSNEITVNVSATDNCEIGHFEFYLDTNIDGIANGVLDGTTSSSSYTYTGLSNATTYEFYSKSVDVAGNTSDAGNVEQVTTISVKGKKLLMIKITPNPVSDFLKIISKKTKISTYKIFDITGQQISCESFDFPKSNCIIDVRKLSKGIYIIRFINEFNEIGMIKFIKE